jgi:hypothetical protein
MELIKRLARLYFFNRSILALLLLVSALEGIFLLRTLWPEFFDFVVAKHIFEIVVLSSIIQIIILLWKLLEKSPRRVCKDEHECAVLLRERIAQDSRASKVLFFSAGLASRFDLITTIHSATSRTLSVEVLAQNPEKALDRQDAKRLESHLLILNRDHSEIPLEVRIFDTPATIRSSVICDDKGSPLWGVASWYRYDDLGEEGIRLVGRRNPAVVFDADTSREDSLILEFLTSTFRNLWAQSADKIIYPKRS